MRIHSAWKVTHAQVDFVTQIHILADRYEVETGEHLDFGNAMLKFGPKVAKLYKPSSLQGMQMELTDNTIITIKEVV